MLKIMAQPLSGKPHVLKTGEFTAVVSGILAATRLGVEIMLEHGKPPVVIMESKPGVWYALQDGRFWIQGDPPAVFIPPGWDPDLPLGLVVEGAKSAWIEGTLDPKSPPITMATAYE